MVDTDGIRSKRYERKFTLPLSMQENLESIIYTNTCGFREIYCERKVNNIYYDTPTLQHYNENVNGVSNRKKIRVRWYGDDFKKGNPKLEIKRKYGLLGTKGIFPISCDFTYLFNPEFIRSLNLPIIESHDLKEEYPILLNTYQRKYFLSADGRFRATIDYNLHYFFPSQTSPCQSLGLADHECVLELKYDSIHDSDANGISRQFPARLGKKSKYVSGIEKIYNC